MDNRLVSSSDILVRERAFGPSYNACAGNGTDDVGLSRDNTNRGSRYVPASSMFRSVLNKSIPVDKSSRHRQNIRDLAFGVSGIARHKHNRDRVDLSTADVQYGLRYRSDQNFPVSIA